MDFDSQVNDLQTLIGNPESYDFKRKHKNNYTVLLDNLAWFLNFTGGYRDVIKYPKILEAIIEFLFNVDVYGYDYIFERLMNALIDNKTDLHICPLCWTLYPIDEPFKNDVCADCYHPEVTE